MGNIKGIGYKAEIQFVRTTYGEEALNAILATLSPEDQAALRGTVLTSGWYPHAPLERFRQAVATHFHDANLAVIEEMGRYSSQFALTGIYRIFLAIASPAYAIRKVGNLFPTYFDRGRAEAVERGPGEVSVIIRDWEDSSATLCAMMKGYFERSLELAGARGVTVRKVSCVHRGDPCCEYRGTWT